MPPAETPPRVTLPKAGSSRRANPSLRRCRRRCINTKASLPRQRATNPAKKNSAINHSAFSPCLCAFVRVPGPAEPLMSCFFQKWLDFTSLRGGRKSPYAYHSYYVSLCSPQHTQENKSQHPSPRKPSISLWLASKPPHGRFLPCCAERRVRRSHAAVGACGHSHMGWWSEQYLE
jgi:hypothetical protein